MKNECSIVQDILPLYVEEMVSDDTVSFVREHLKDCPRCRAELEKLQKPVEVQLKPDINAAPRTSAAATAVRYPLPATVSFVRG